MAPAEKEKETMTEAALVTTPTTRELLVVGLAQMGLTLDDLAQENLLRYVALLHKWNKVYNLTAVREPERMIGLHILDSLSVMSQIGASETLLDVGTGGGLPGIPLAIALHASPGVKITMLDTVAKKTTFVRQAIVELGLRNADVVTERVEKFQPSQRFDIVISRAFSELKDLVDGAGHLCADDGRMLAMKGVNPFDEIARLPGNFAVEQVIQLNVPQVDGQRHLVVIKKINANK
jgi:16S rRNA (guanine527-N7)-methyltransferase